MALHFTMLNGNAIVIVVQLYRLVGRSSCLIRSGIFAKPEVDVVIVVRGGTMSVEYDIRIVVEETPVVVFWPWDNLELFNAPNF